MNSFSPWTLRNTIAAPEPAWEEIVRNSGGQFDPQVVEIFGRMVETDLLPRDTGMVAFREGQPVEPGRTSRRMGAKPPAVVAR